MLVFSIEETPFMREEHLAVTAAAIPANQKPSDIFLDGTLVLEATFDGDTVGWFTASDPDEYEIFTFSLIDDAGGRFIIDEFQSLVVAKGTLIDFETAPSHTISVRVTDSAGQTFDKSFIITVIDTTSDGIATGPSLYGSDGADTLSGTTGKDTLHGSFGNDILEGSAGDDVLFGDSDNDILRGGDGSDWLVGGYGRDILFGGKGKDGFAFDAKPDRKDLDKIADFSVKDDSIFLDDTSMTKLGSRVGSRAVKLKKEFFVIGNKAKDSNDYVIYDDKKGILYYDKNGSSAGGAVAIATLSKKLKMTAADFLIY